jgi:hypothetical protein
MIVNNWRLSILALALAASGGMVAYDAGAATTVTTILPITPVSSGNVADFETPIDFANGSVYTVNVELPQGGTPGINLLTVVRKGTPVNGTWQWQATTVENRTMDDTYHAVGSIAVDNTGYVHVVYNMHNMPWQYSVSTQPYSINAFTFKGEPLTLAQLGAVKFLNQTNFPNFGSAAIPGTQVTYPAFFKDRNGELYVTYRFAAYPKLTWAQRVYSCGIAHYNTTTKLWNAIGGSIPVTAVDGNTPAGQPPVTSVTAFCSTPGSWGLRVRLQFDAQNMMHVVWGWEDYTVFALSQQPSTLFQYATSSDGGQTFQNDSGATYTLPIAQSAGESIEELPPGQEAQPGMVQDASNKTYVVLPPPSSPFQFLTWNSGTSSWAIAGASPWGAPDVESDGQGGLIAFASGPTILRSPSGNVAGPWTGAYAEKDTWGYPKVVYVPSQKAFYARYMKCTGWVPSGGGTVLSQGTCNIRILQVQL